VLLLLVVVLAPPAAASSWEPAALFGADVRSLAIDPQDPDRVLAGTSAGHLYLSRDGGESWQAAGPRWALAGWVVSDLVFDPHVPGRLWAALYGVWRGGLVAWSDDSGQTWTPRREGIPPEEQVYALAHLPETPGHLFAATRRGVYASRDEGRSWQLATASHPEIREVYSFLVDRRRPRTVVAGTWQRAYRSDDAGATWHPVFDGMIPDSHVFSLRAVPWQDGEVWASTCGWVYRSRDWGASWKRHQQGLAERRTPSFQVLVDGRLLAGTVGGLYVSEDGGASWQRRTSPDLAVLAIAHHPARPERVLLGTEGAGVWISGDRAASFRPASHGLTNLRVMGLVRSGDAVLAAVNHAGPWSGIHRSRDGGISFAEREPLPTVLDLARAEDGDGGARVYAATERGLWEHDGGSWRRIAEVGEGRVDEVRAAAGRVVARAGSRLWERRGARFAPIPYRHGPPRSTALHDEALWVSDEKALYRLAGDGNDTVAAPFSGGRLTAAGEALLLAGAGGVWSRRDLASPWRELLAEKARPLPTGDRRFPLVLAGVERAWIVAAGDGAPRPLALPIPARDLAAALVVDDRLLLGTSGYGLLLGALPGVAGEP
jgi:photosystem II stability/assembly factor-like uncharacterized protein